MPLDSSSPGEALARNVRRDAGTSVNPHDRNASPQASARMAKLLRARVADWTVLAAALSLTGISCSSDRPKLPDGSENSGQSGVDPNGTSTSPGVNTVAPAGPTSTTPVPSTTGTTGGPGGSPVAPGGTAGGGTGATMPTTPAPANSGATGPMPSVPVDTTDMGGSGPEPDSTSPEAGTGPNEGTGTSGDGTDAGTDTSGTGSGNGDYNPDFVEFVGEDCELPEPTLLASPDHSLPDPFLMPDGSRMANASQWACQRAWLKKNMAAFVHGEKPGRPDTVTGSVSAMSIEVAVEHGGKSADFSVSVRLPGGGGPVPAMFQADGSGVPTNFLHGEGVAAINYSHSAAEGAFNAIYGGSGVADTIKWAWAVSRVIDVLVDQRDAGGNDIIDPTGLGTTGCSYAGKSAFIVAAYDERIALGIPMESGTGGLGSYRVVGDKDLGPNSGEDPEQVNEACGQGWLTSSVCSGNVDTIPADAHFLVAMYAPRGFTTLENNRIGHLGPVAGYVSTAAGAEVFKALGVESHIGYHGGNDGDPHNHCSFNQSQQETTRKAIHGFLTKTEEPANFMEPKLRNQSNQPVDFQLGNYIDWETPVLQ